MKRLWTGLIWVCNISYPGDNFSDSLSENESMKRQDTAYRNDPKSSDR